MTAILDSAAPRAPGSIQVSTSLVDPHPAMPSKIAAHRHPRLIRAIAASCRSP
jgi:hypothetical protein